MTSRDRSTFGALFPAIGLVVACATPPTSPSDAPPTTASASAPATTPSAVAPAATARPRAGGPPIPVERENLVRAVDAVAIERSPGSPGHDAVRRRLVGELRRLPYDVAEEKVTASGAQTGVNVVARKKGTTHADEHVVVSAHYDHIPFCPGADDNASGVAALLEIARVLAKTDFPRSLDLAFWDLEETGLHGSGAFASEAYAAKRNVVVAISLDAIGFAARAPGTQSLPPGFATAFPDVDRKLTARGYAGDFIAFLGDDGPGATAAIAALEGRADQISLPTVGLGLSALRRIILNDVARSDHASFWLRGYGGVMVTDTANFRNPAYHCFGAIDHARTLDYDFLAKVTQTVAGATSDLLQAPSAP